MKKIVIGAAIVAGIGLLLFVGSVAYVYFIIFGNADRTIARNLSVTNEWTEVSIDPPVKPSYDHQAIYLRPVGFKVDLAVKGNEIRLPDGTVVEPEVEVYDENGKAFRMHKSGFAMAREDYVEFWPEPTWTLPKNRKYSSVRIRSDVPFVCESVSWIDYSPP